MEVASNSVRPNVFVLCVTSTYIKVPGDHNGFEEATSCILNHIETNSTDNHGLLVCTDPETADVVGNFADGVKADPKTHNHVEPRIAAIKHIGVDGVIPSLVGKGDTTTRVLKNGKHGPVKVLPGKDKKAAACTDY